MSGLYFKRVMQNTPTCFWINNVTREEAKLAIEAGARNCTQNPSYPWKIIYKSADGEHAKRMLDDIILSEKDDETALHKLQCALITDICRTFEPIFKSSGGKNGWVTVQASPIHEDLDTILTWGRIHHRAAPNMMLKIPATKAGIEALDILLREGCAVLATEVMSVAQVIDVCELYKKASSQMEQAPVMYLAHIAGIFDEHLQATVQKEGINVDPDALWQAGIIVAKKIRRVMDDRDYRVNMLSGGARGLQHFTEMVGARSGVTINWVNTADKLLELDGPAVDRFSAQPSPDAVDELLEKIPDFKKAYDRKGLAIEDYEAFGPVTRFRNAFESAWLKCLDYIAKRRIELRS
jgi:transaldolase